MVHVKYLILDRHPICSSKNFDVERWWQLVIKVCIMLLQQKRKTCMKKKGMNKATLFRQKETDHTARTLGVCMCVHVCMCVCMHRCVCMCACMCVCVCVCMCVCVCVCVCVHAMCVCMCVCVHAYMCACIHVCMHACVCMCVSIDVCACICACISGVKLD
jgi:hypothetical protein